MKCNQSRPGFELASPCPFPATITMTPHAHPNINPSRFILRLEVRKLRSLYFYIYIFWLVVSLDFFFFLHTVVYKVFLSNSNNLPRVVWFQVFLSNTNKHIVCPVGWGCRIHLYECPGYDTKQSDGEVPVIVELWGMQSTSSLSSLPGPLWPRSGSTW